MIDSEEADKSDRIQRLRKQTQRFWQEKLAQPDPMPAPEPPPSEVQPDALEQWDILVEELEPDEDLTQPMHALSPLRREPPQAPVLVMTPPTSLVEAQPIKRTPVPEQRFDSGPTLRATTPTSEAQERGLPDSFRPLIPYPDARPLPVAPSLLMETEHIETAPPDARASSRAGRPKAPRRIGVVIAAVGGAVVAAALWAITVAGKQTKEAVSPTQIEAARELHREAGEALKNGDTARAKKLLALCVSTGELAECKQQLDELSSGLSQVPTTTQ